MKKIVTIVALIACCYANTLIAQDWNQVSLYPGISSLRFRAMTGDVESTITPSVGVEYRRSIPQSFLESWSIGVNYSNLRTMWNMPMSSILMPQRSGDIVFCDFFGFSEIQTATLFSLTPMLYKDINNITIGVGPTLGVLNSKWSNHGQITTSLQDSITGVVLREDIGDYGLGTFAESSSGKYTKIVYGISMEAGTVLKDNLYLGVYGNLNFIPNVRETVPIISGVGDVNTQDISYNGFANSDLMESGKTFTVGFKIGYRWTYSEQKPEMTEVPNTEELDRLKDENNQLKKKLKSLEDSIRVMQSLGLDSNQRMVDLLLRDYARLCLASPYDKDKHDNYKEMFSMNNFATNYYRTRCEGYLKVLDQYANIQQEYVNMMSSISSEYKNLKRTQRSDGIERAYSRLVAYQGKWNKKISDLGMKGLEDIPYINNLLVRNIDILGIMKETKVFPETIEEFKDRLRID